MVSLYYKALEPHMRKFRKNLNMQEMNDQLHNVNLKQELNQDLNKENAILGQISSDLQRDQIKKKYAEHLGQHKEGKLQKKAENKAKLEILKEEAKNRLQNKKLPIITPAKIKAQNAFKVQSKINHIIPAKIGTERSHRIRSNIFHNIIPAKVGAQRAHRIKSDIQRDILNEQNPIPYRDIMNEPHPFTPAKVKAERVYRDIMNEPNPPSIRRNILNEQNPYPLRTLPKIRSHFAQKSKSHLISNTYHPIKTHRPTKTELINERNRRAHRKALLSTPATSIMSDAPQSIDARHHNTGAQRKTDTAKMRELKELTLKKKNEGLTNKDKNRIRYLKGDISKRMKKSLKETMNTLI